MTRTQIVELFVGILISYGNRMESNRVFICSRMAFFCTAPASLEISTLLEMSKAAA